MGQLSLHGVIKSYIEQLSLHWVINFEWGDYVYMG